MKIPYLSSCPRCRNVSNMGLMNVSRIIFPVLMLWAGCLPSATGQSLELLELPDVSEKELVSLPKNLARWHMDVSLTYIDENGLQEQVSINNSEQTGIGVLLSDDETLAYNFNKGAHSLIINLLNPYPINRLFLMSYSATGSVDIAVSGIPLPLESRRWINVGENIPVKPRQRTNYTFPIIQARYVQLNFKIEEAGEIASLGLFGEPNIGQTKFQRRESESESGEVEISDTTQTISYDYASLYTGTEIAYLNSGSLTDANLMIDDDSSTYYEFDPEDEQSILVLDLKQNATVNKLSLLYESGPGTLQFYFLANLDDVLEKDSNKSAQRPGSAGSNVGNLNVVTLPEKFFQNNEPVAVQVVEPGNERVRMNFNKLSGRYLLIRWLPVRTSKAQGKSD